MPNWLFQVDLSELFLKYEESYCIEDDVIKNEACPFMMEKLQAIVDTIETSTEPKIKRYFLKDVTANEHLQRLKDAIERLRYEIFEQDEFNEFMDDLYDLADEEVYEKPPTNFMWLKTCN